MSTTLIWAFVCLIIFVAVLAHPKLPNWMTFICMAPVVLLAKVMEAKDIYAVLNSSSLHLMIIICMFSGMIAATGLDIIIGDFVDHMTSSQTGKKKEMMIFAIVYLVSGLISTVLQNSYVALAFLPVLKSIARKNRISLSKLVLFVIFATTLGGAITLIGTPTNVYANTALEEAGLQLFGMLDFAWVGIPIFIVGGIYMIVMNRWCASYDDFGEETEEKALTSGQRRKQMVVGITFLVFVAALVLKSLKVISIDPNFIGYAMIAVAVITAFYLGLKNGGAAMASTMAFSTLTLARLFHGFNCRGKQFIFKMGFTTNPYSIYAFAAGAAFLGLVIFIPGLHGLFQIQTMPVTAMIQVAVLAFIPTAIIQLRRKIINA